MRIVRITGSGFVKQGSVTPGHPVESRHWKDVVNDIDCELEAAVHSEEEEAVVDLWLEDPQSFQEDTQGAGRGAVTMVRTGGMGMQRVGIPHKTAADQNWDQDFSEAREHVASVLKNLGNGVDRNYQYREPTPGKVR